MTVVEEARPTIDQPARTLDSLPGLGDRIFRRVVGVAGMSVLAIMVGVGLFLLGRGFSAIRIAGFGFLTTEAWNPDAHHFGIAAVLTDTVIIAIIAIVVATPIALGASLFISEAAPKWAKQSMRSMVDLMAAVPSVVYGLWGAFFLQNHMIGFARFLSSWLGWIPFFHVAGDSRSPSASLSTWTASPFIAGVVVAMMVIPIQASIMREVFSQAPAGERESAYALGATRWGMIRSVVLPFGKGGIIGGTMLGLGRALGETIAVYMIISPVFTINLHVLGTGGNSVSSLIALRYGDATGVGLSALMAAGLSLFALTLAVNFTASSIIARSRSGADSEA
jgi:phosphate transport system permease protein